MPMPEGFALASIAPWRDELGLRPVPLYSDLQAAGRYVLLNGLQGNFCLDLTPAPEIDQRSVAWSSNVSHYVAVEPKQVLVQRWDYLRPERFTVDSVAGALERFHAYLEAEQPDSSQSSIAHAIRVFRAIRGALGTRFRGPQALEGFLCLLACAIDDAEVADLDAARWALSQEALDVTQAIPAEHWESLKEDLGRGRSLQKLHLDLRLLIRHAGGTLFEEAHHEALFDSQMGLFAPSPARIARSTSELGVHFTPSPLVRTLVEESLRAMPQAATVRVFDPACGSGEFLCEALRQLRQKQYQGQIHLIGWDLSSAACAMARFALACEQNGDGKVIVSIECKDSILNAWPDGLTCVLMNPPFVAWPDIPPSYVEPLRHILGPAHAFRPDLASAFVVKAVDRLPAEAILATLLPASFLDSTSMVALRDQLSARLGVLSVARLGSHDLFAGAKVDAGFLVGRKLATAGAGEEPLVIWADSRPTSTSAALRALRRMRGLPSAHLSHISMAHFSLYRRSLLSESWAPRPYAAWNLQQSLVGAPTVRNLFAVRQGCLTGLNRAFVLTPEQLGKLPSRERSYFRPAVLNDSISQGRLRTTAHVFYPYGELVIESESQLRARLPRYLEHQLVRHKDALQMRSGVSGQWWDLTRPRQWQVAPQAKIVSTYFGDAGSFAWDESGCYVVVQGYGWLPRRKAPFSEATWLAYLALLNSETFSLLLSAASNHVGGGQWNLSKRFVDKIALPDLDRADVDLDIVKSLADLGRTMHTEGALSITPARRREWNEVVALAFGLDTSSQG